MRKARAFAEFVFGGFDDPYTWLIWACFLGGFVEIDDTPRWLIVAGVEVITVVMRVWTRDVIAEKRRRKEADRAA